MITVGPEGTLAQVQMTYWWNRAVVQFVDNRLSIRPPKEPSELATIHKCEFLSAYGYVSELKSKDKADKLGQAACDDGLAAFGIEATPLVSATANNVKPASAERTRGNRKLTSSRAPLPRRPDAADVAPGGAAAAHDAAKADDGSGTVTDCSSDDEGESEPECRPVEKVYLVESAWLQLGYLQE